MAVVRKILLVVFCISTFCLSAQNRPKVGIALSGGGAKSMSQLGALRAIEEAGITIDYISGTSMGAVIGAMYAMGYTVDEMEYYLNLVDWEQLLSDEIPRNRLPYLNKNDEKYLLSIDINDGKFILPRAFNDGHYMHKILSYLTLQYQDVQDFSQLPIPFLCIGTNLETGESVIFETGSLSEALRASVAFPSIFSPQEIDSTLYVDGGVRNNMPIDVLKENKNMDIVIAIDVQGNLYDKNGLTSIIQVLEQVGSFQNAIYCAEQLERANVVIQPNVSPFSIRDYYATDTLIKRGYNCAKIQADVLAEIGKSQGVTPPLRPSGMATPPTEFIIDSLVIAGATENQKRYAKGQLHIRKNKPYNYKKLDRGLDFLYGSGNFDNANYTYKTINGKKTLELDLKEKPSRHALRFGLHYDDDFSIALLANYTMRNAGMSNATLKTEFAVSENPRGSISWILERGFVPALGFKASFNRFQPRIYENSQPISEFIFFTYNVDLFLHSTLANNFTIGTGIKLDNVNLSQDLPIDNFENQDNTYLIYHAFLDFDSFNKNFKATSGYLLKSKFNLITDTREDVAKSASSIISLQFSKAFAFSRKFGGQVGLSGAATIGGQLAYPYNIFVGGLGQNYINFTFPFLGYRHMELVGDNFASANGSIFYQFVKNHYVTVEANFGKLQPTFENIFDSNVLLDGYGLSYGYNSPIGPLQLTVMSSSNHAQIFTYISLGFWF